VTTDPKSRIRRILNIIPYVRKNPGVPLEDLARYCGADASEVMQDLDRILLCGTPPYLPDDYIGVYVDAGRVEVRFADHFRRPVRFTSQEALAMLLAMELLPESTDPEQVEAKRSLEDKIRNVLRLSLSPGSDEVDGGRLNTRTGSESSKGLPQRRERVGKVLAVLNPAIASQRDTEIEYYSASRDETGKRVVEPFGLVEKHGDHYLIARDKSAGKEPRSYRVDRVREARMLEGTFEPPSRFNVKRYEKTRMDFTKRHQVEAQVRVTDQRVVRWLKETRDKDLVHEKGGAAVVTIRAYSMPWLLNEILSWGPDLELLGPPEVREALVDHLRDMRARATA
jgi:proteasome accessory factor C